MTALEKLKNIIDLLPTHVAEDVSKRCNDWMSSGGDADDPYIYQQLRYVKKFFPGNEDEEDEDRLHI